MSTRGRFGLRSLLHLAMRRDDGPVSVSEIANEMGVSPDYLMQLFVKLRREGLLESVRGPRGGFRFARPVDDITVGDVIRSVESSVSPIHCVEEKSGDVVGRANSVLCEKALTCVSRLAWVDITRKLVKLFDSMTLADVIRMGKEKNLYVA
jgi:Rrf2 family cysteine metabolism transcriptional repressor